MIVVTMDDYVEPKGQWRKSPEFLQLSDFTDIREEENAASKWIERKELFQDADIVVLLYVDNIDETQKTKVLKSRW